MTNDYHGLYSISTNQYVHVNHGWWCTECTNHLFEIDKQTDHTKEWVDVMRQWSTIVLLWLWDTFLAFGSAVISIVLGIAWILLCFFEGVDSDTRIYEEQLHAKDGLSRAKRDNLNSEYSEVLRERHQVLKDIDRCKSNMGIDSGYKQFCLDRKELQTNQQKLDLINARLDGFEKELRIHKGV